MSPDEVARIAGKVSGATAIANTLRNLDAAGSSVALGGKLTKVLEGIQSSATITGALPDVGPTITGAVLASGTAKALEGIDSSRILASGTITGATIATGAVPNLDAAGSSVALGGKLTKVLEGIQSSATIVPWQPVASDLAPHSEPWLLSHEVSEFFAADLARVDREEAVFLLADADLEEAQQHLDAIEERFLFGSGPSQLHAALSASLLLRSLADRLFPPRSTPWECRFEELHPVGSRNVGNRLSAFVDSRLRSHLSTKEHRLFQATLDSVLGWAGEGHHVLRSPRDAARAFRQFLEVLAMISRAYRSRVRAQTPESRA